jgi:hypothetical protein
MVEIIWTGKPLNFYKDITILLTSDSQIKLPIVNPEIIRNTTLVREFDKVRATEIEKGFIVSSMVDGQKFIDSNRYRTEVQDMISKYIEEAREKKLSTNTQRPYCLPAIIFSTHNGQVYYVSVRIINVGLQTAIAVQLEYDIKDVHNSKKTLNIPFLQPTKDLIHGITIGSKSSNGTIRRVELQYDEKSSRTVNVTLQYKDIHDIKYETNHELSVNDFY